ncbi:MAG: ABC transporter permease [Acidobacteriota bacterium]|nr:ABC transporter permease [Acidobacteriota bacterium]
MNKILTIYLKELIEVLRDRRTLIFMIVLPTVILPLLFNVIIGFVVEQEKKADAATIRTTLINADSVPGLKTFLEGEKGYEMLTGFKSEDLKAAIREDRLDLGLVFPDDAAEVVEGGYQLELSAYYNNASLTNKALSRIRKAVGNYSEKKRGEKLAELGVTSAFSQRGVIEPVIVRKVGIAEKREIIGERVGGFLPYFFIIFCFVGALYPAIDISAGEKERGTLETLLLTPVPRSYLVAGKFLVVFTSGIISSVLCLTSMGVWIAIKTGEFGQELGEIIKSVTPMDLILIGSMMVPLAAIFAAILLSVSVYAKNFKEAQSYVTPFNFLIILPAVVAMLPVELDWKWAMVPVSNVALAIKELVKGTMDYTMLAVIFGSTVLVGAAGFLFCINWFKRESVLFRN